MPKNMVIRLLMFGFGAVLTTGMVLVGGNSANAQRLPPAEQMVAERVLGKATAAVELIEYASLSCPHCAAFHNGPWPTLKKEYVDTGKVKLIYRDFPTDKMALAASMIARCAPEERYFGIIELMFRTQDDWRRSKNPRGDLANIGRLAGMSQATVEACLRNKILFEVVIKQRNEGNQKLNVNSTPTFIVNGRKIDGVLSLEEFRLVFDQALAKAAKK